MSKRDPSAVIGQLRTDLDERLRAVVIKRVAAHVTSGEQFTVEHTLGITPSIVAALPFTDARVWAEEADRRIWNEKKVALRCNISSAPLSLVVIE